MIRIIQLLTTTCFLLLACNPPRGTPHKAYQMQSETVYLNKVEAGTNDDSDWHQILVPALNGLRLRIKPQKSSEPVGTIEIFNEQGQLVATSPIRESGNTLEIEGSLTKGVVYSMQIQVSSGYLLYLLMAELITIPSK